MSRRGKVYRHLVGVAGHEPSTTARFDGASHQAEACNLTCGRPQPGGETYDTASAKQTLVAALDAWKSGQAAQLTKRQPPIRFADDDFRDGSRLVSYELNESDSRFGLHANAIVKLTLLTRQGKTVTKSASYQISLSPSLAVLRTDS